MQWPVEKRCFYVAKGALPELVTNSWFSIKNSELAKRSRCFSFTWYYWLKWGQKLPKNSNKKAHISNTLAGGEIQALQSAKADQHRDRITRFATLKHRAKNQENYLFTLAKFKENYEKDVKNEESIEALKSAQKLNECGNYLLFKNFYTIGESSSQNSAPAASISYALSVLLYARHAPFNAMLNVSTKSYRKIVSLSPF